MSLFDGTGSVVQPFKNAGWNVIRLDIDGRFGADIVADILKWEPSTLSVIPDVIIGGPPCEQFSIARTMAKTPRNIDLANSLLDKTVAVINFFKAQNPNLIFFIENPDSSKMWGQESSMPLYHKQENHPLSPWTEPKKLAPATMAQKIRHRAHLDKHVVRLDYCQYGFPYRKRTRFMTNAPWRGKLCDPTTCAAMDPTRSHHLKTAQRGAGKLKDGTLRQNDSFTVDQLHAYPPKLVEELLYHCTTVLSRH